MVYSKTLSDGTLVEYCCADAYSGPNNCFSNMHVNSNVVWVRFDNEKWLETDLKQMHKARIAIEAAQTKEDLHSILSVIIQ